MYEYELSSLVAHEGTLTNGHCESSEWRSTVSVKHKLTLPRRHFHLPRRRRCELCLEPFLTASR